MSVSKVCDTHLCDGALTDRKVTVYLFLLFLPLNQIKQENNPTTNETYVSVYQRNESMTK